MTARLADHERQRIYTRGTPIQRVMERLTLDERNCWLWDGAKSTAGYGHVNLGRGLGWRHAHRLTYEHFIGPIPEGLELDHLCRVRNCVNPWHLEAVTHRENVRRGRSPNMLLHLAGVCRRGHPATEATRRRSTGHVVYCRACRREDRAAA